MSDANDQLARQTSRYLTVGLVTIGIAFVYVVWVFISPSPGLPCFLLPLTLMALFFGGVSVLCALTWKANRIGRRFWKHLAVLFANVGLLLLFTVGPCSFFGLLNLQLRLAVARTGGQDRLRTWAMDVLEKSREHMDEHVDSWPIPREDWSDQVRRLHPRSILVRVKFENDQRGVCLDYGGGFLHWSLVIGLPGSRPDPRLREGRNRLIPWADGIFLWIYG